IHGNYCKDGEGHEEKAQVLHAAAQPLQDLWAAARVPAQVRHLPLVLPRAGAAGRDSRRFQVVLVTKLEVQLAAAGSSTEANGRRLEEKQANEVDRSGRRFFDAHSQ